MQKRRSYSNNTESDPSGPSKSYTAKITFRDKLKVNSLLSDSAEEGKLTHLLEVLQTLETHVPFSSLLHHPPGKNKTKKPPKPLIYLTERYPSTKLCQKLENPFKGHKDIFPKD